MAEEDLSDTFRAWRLTGTAFSVVDTGAVVLEDVSFLGAVAASSVGVEGGVGGGERDDRGGNASRVLSTTFS